MVCFKSWRTTIFMRDVAAIVVTYNRKDLLLENIKCLLNQSRKDCLDIIVIDNASTDDTRSALDKYIINKDITYVNTGANLGGAGGFQYGIRLAAEHEYKYVWVMDDDCMSKQNALEEFLSADKKLESNYGFLSSKVLWKDNNICSMNIQRKTVFKKVKDFSTTLVPVTMASFVSLFIPIHIVNEVGLPIKEFFIWTDDWEYTRRISRKYKCYLMNKSVVIHKSNTNIGANITNDSLDRLDRYDYLYRNDVYLYRREGMKGALYEVLRLVYHSIMVLCLAPNSKLKRLKKIWVGTFNGISFKPSVEYVERHKNI
jgi:GT2 family glycosyltransferase